MMLTSSILASGNDLLGFVVFVVFLFLWALHALASILKKASDAAKKPPVPARPPRMDKILTERVPPKRPPAAARRPIAGSQPLPPALKRLLAQYPTLGTPTPIQPSASAPPPLPPKLRRPPRVPAAPPAPALPVPQPPPAALLSARPQPPASAGANRPASAPSLRRWLEPQSLRRQVILSELLQPPIALREGPPATATGSVSRF